MKRCNLLFFLMKQTCQSVDLAMVNNLHFVCLVHDFLGTVQDLSDLEVLRTEEAVQAVNFCVVDNLYLMGFVFDLRGAVAEMRDLRFF